MVGSTILPCNGVLCSSEKEREGALWTDVEWFLGHNPKWKKQSPKGYLYYAILQNSTLYYASPLKGEGRRKYKSVNLCKRPMGEVDQKLKR